MSQDKARSREASPQEEARMVGWVRWAYEHGLPVAYWPEADAITPYPINRSIDAEDVVLLRKVTNAQSVQSSVGDAAPSG
jgi:hypothetical protein